MTATQEQIDRARDQIVRHRRDAQDFEREAAQYELQEAHPPRALVCRAAARESRAEADALDALLREREELKGKGTSLYDEVCQKLAEAQREIERERAAHEETRRRLRDGVVRLKNTRMEGMRIRIKPSPTADTRTCDWSKVSKVELLHSSLMHRDDVSKALGLFQLLLTAAADRHDFDKLSEIDWFHADFATGFKQTGWWDNHRKVNRHHLSNEDGIPEDVNLIDVLDYIADCVMAGMARSGSVYDITLPSEVLQHAFQNTVALLKSSVEVEAREGKTDGR